MKYTYPHNASTLKVIADNFIAEKEFDIDHPFSDMVMRVKDVQELVDELLKYVKS